MSASHVKAALFLVLFIPFGCGQDASPHIWVNRSPASVESGPPKITQDIPEEVLNFVNRFTNACSLVELRESARRFMKENPRFREPFLSHRWPEILGEHYAFEPPESVEVDTTVPGRECVMFGYTLDGRGCIILVSLVDEFTVEDPSLIAEGDATVLLDKGVYLHCAPRPSPISLEPRDLAGRLREFLSLVQRTFTARELRDVAEEFFKVNSDFEGVLSQDQLPDLLRKPLGQLRLPTAVFVSSKHGVRVMRIEYFGSHWMQGIYIQSPVTVEAVAGQPHEKLYWEEGVGVYLVPPLKRKLPAVESN